MAERILLVEDDPVFRSVLEDNLLYEGYRVDAVADGNAALIHVKASKPDLIVLDLTLPDDVRLQVINRDFLQQTRHGREVCGGACGRGISVA